MDRRRRRRPSTSTRPIAGPSAPTPCSRAVAAISMPMPTQASPGFMKPIPTGAHAPLTEVACWAHARRKIYDIHVERKSPAAAHALEMIAPLFAIEADIKGRPPAERLAARRAKATPILSELRPSSTRRWKRSAARAVSPAPSATQHRAGPR